MPETDAPTAAPVGGSPPGAPPAIVRDLEALLAQDRTPEAARVYARCPPQVGFDLVERAASAETSAREQLAKMFYLARDYYRAAVIYEGLDAFEKAQAFYEQAGELPLAAELALRMGRKSHAAELFERAGSYLRAARLYVEMGQREEATRAFEHSRLQGPRREKAARELEGTALATSTISAADAMADYDFLQTTSLFDTLTLPEIQSLYRICTKRVFSPGATIIEQGRLGYALYILYTGTVEVQRVFGDRVETVTTLEPGAYFGEMALLDPEAVTSARIVAKEPLQTFEITRENFLKLMKRDTPLEAKLYRVFVGTLCERLRLTTSELAALRAKKG